MTKLFVMKLPRKSDDDQIANVLAREHEDELKDWMSWLYRAIKMCDILALISRLGLEQIHEL
jgi:hypothetical protein